MNRFTDSGRRSRPGQGRRHVVGIAAGILLVAIGAILRFALTVGTPRELHVHDVGVVLILAGAAGLLLLPGSSGGGLRSVWLRTRWISPGQTRPYPDTTGPAVGRGDDGTAAADIPEFEFEPPPAAPPRQRRP